MTSILTIADIIREAGGPSTIERAFAVRQKSVTRDAVYKWRNTGIPDRHWPIIIELTDRTPSEIYEANLLARGETEFSAPAAAE
jgi:hypothetical protein